MKDIFLKAKNDNTGMTTLLVAIVLVAVSGLALIIANSNITVSRINQSIGGSEKAFYGAETATDITIFQIEKENGGLSLPVIVDKVMDGDNDVTWSREVLASYETPGLCSAFKTKPICSNSSGDINDANPLNVTLEDGEKFQFDLNISGADYPDSIEITWSGTGSTVLVFSNNGQTEYSTSPVTVPGSGVLDPDQGYRIRITNSSGSTVTYTITPQGGITTKLPMGLLVKTDGKYKKFIRKLDIIRPSWIIY